MKRARTAIIIAAAFVLVFVAAIVLTPPGKELAPPATNIEDVETVR